MHGPAIDTRIMVVDQAPGVHEATRGRPFAHTADGADRSPSAREIARATRAFELKFFCKAFRRMAGKPRMPYHSKEYVQPVRF